MIYIPNHSFYTRLSFTCMQTDATSIERQFKQITRTCMLRLLAIVQSAPSYSPSEIDLDNFFVRLLHNNYHIKEQIIKEICNIDARNDSIFVGVLTYLQELAIWSSKAQHGSTDDTAYEDTAECIYTQGMKLVTNDKIHYSLNTKRCQLISTLMKMPYCMKNIKVYEQLYRQLQAIREFYPVTVKQEQRRIFMRSIDDSLQEASARQYIHILEYVHQKVSEQIYEMDLSPEIFLSKFRIIKSILKNLTEYDEKILNTSAFLLIRYADKLIDNYGFATLALIIYNEIMEKLIEKPSIVPLCLYCHLIINNLVKLQRKPGFMFFREILLSQVSKIFEVRFLKYFLKYYDWNFMEEDICLNSLKILYEYTQDHSNEKNHDYELYKKHLTLIQKQIENFVMKVLPGQEQRQFRKEMKQFYDLKAKEYRHLVDKINNKPKDIFKMLDAIQTESAKDDFIQKILKVLKKSRHIEPKSMINIVSAGTPNSDLMMDRYLQTFITACRGKNLQQFIRLFTSNFFLWGEAQQIQRVIDKLTVFYCNNQVKQQLVFKNSDVAYTFANAIIILNTDIHNPKNQNKMSLQDFFKICRKINQGEDLPEEMIREIYHNIKHDEILTFRECYKMSRINLYNWRFIASDTESVPISYFDLDMAQLSENQFYSYAYELLTNLIDEKQTAKLELMVERFQYSEKKFDCQILEKIRILVPSKPHLAMHILQKVYEQARFPSRIIDDKLISYYWLASKIIENFSEYLPYSKICQFLLLTWRIGFELKDTLKMKEQAQLKLFKKMLRQYKKRQTKKSIMDMFSKFLSNKDSDHQQEAAISPTILLKKKINYTNCGFDILNILMKSSDSRTRAAESILMSLKHEDSKRYEQFLSCLYVFFVLLEDCRSEESEEILLGFFEQIFNFEPCKLGERIQNLKTKSPEKHDLLESYCHFQALKLLLPTQNHLQTKSNHFQKKKKILMLSIQFLKKCNKSTTEELILKNIKLSVEETRSYLTELQILGEVEKCLKFYEIGPEIYCGAEKNEAVEKKQENSNTVEKANSNAAQKEQESSQKTPQSKDNEIKGSKEEEAKQENNKETPSSPKQQEQNVSKDDRSKQQKQPQPPIEQKKVQTPEQNKVSAEKEDKQGSQKQLTEQEETAGLPIFML